MGKSVKSATVQLAFFLLVPSIMAMAGVAVMFFTNIGIVFLAIAALGSAAGAFIVAANIFGLRKVRPPQKAELNLSVAKSKLASVKSAQSENEIKANNSVTLLLAVIWFVPVAAFGWLLFILFCCGKFMRKTRAVASDTDRADKIVSTANGTLEEIVYCFYRMTDYASVYISINETKSARQMTERAQCLLGVWEKLYPDN
ncbi:MAG: hypothetical protein OSJ83_06850 [Clostridia bacterium]|nr:hypothetical protein [Clostridia bacterium]